MGRFALLAVLAPFVLLFLQVYQGIRPHEDSYAGLPRAQQLRPWPWDTRWFHVIDQPGFVLGYSEYWRNPLWVAWQLGEKRAGKIGPRPGHFSIDDRTLMRVSSDDYRGSGYDRGHMAPNYAMARFHGRAAQLASFEMSNIVPQPGPLNQKLWQRLEELEADVYAGRSGPLWVVTGPVLGGNPPRLQSGVAIPEAFFRIWLRETGGEIQALGFLVPAEVTGYEALDRFVVSVDAIEAATGLDFFHLLDDVEEAQLEAQIDARAWDLARHANRPPRY